MSVLCLNVCRLCVANRCMLKNCTSSKLARLLDTASKFALFSVSSLKGEQLIKSKPTWKLKHANSILEHFEYFCQMSSKSIPKILSYIVSKLARFFETQCICVGLLTKMYRWAIICIYVCTKNWWDWPWRLPRNEALRQFEERRSTWSWQTSRERWWLKRWWLLTAADFYASCT